MTFKLISTLSLSVMTNPAKGLKEVFSNNSKYIVPLFLLAGGSQAWQNLIYLPKGSIIWSSVFFATLMYVSTAWLLYCLFTALLNYISKFFGGTGNFKDLLTVFAWSMLPIIFVLIGYLILLPFMGEKLFSLQVDGGSGILFNSLLVIKFLAIIWSLIILFRGLVLIHNLTYFRAASSIIIVIVIFSLLRAFAQNILHLF